MDKHLKPFLFLLEEMAPFLLLGFLVAGLLHAFVPGRYYRKWLGGNDLKSVLLSIVFGIPLPLCSCGVIPAAVQMRRQGASKGATTAFLIATPQTGVDSIAATWSVLGLPFAILRPLVAMVTGVFGGVLGNAVSKSGGADTSAACGVRSCDSPEVGPGFGRKLLEALRYGFIDMVADIGKWLVVGLVIAGLITILVPDGFFTAYDGNYVLNMLLIIAVSVPMYVCATGSIPIAAALILKGLSPGAALVFLMAGPATNMASIMVLGKTLGRRSLIVYLASIILGAVVSGVLVDALLPQEWFTSTVRQAFHGSHAHAAGSILPWWKATSTGIVAILLARAGINGLRSRAKTERQHRGMKTYIITGMTCNHCRDNVQKCLEGLEGAVEVNVDLARGTAGISGPVDAHRVIEAVNSIGYGCREA